MATDSQDKSSQREVLKDAAVKILGRNVLLLAEKVKKGEPLTLQEAKLLQGFADADSSPKDTFAKSYVELAEILGVARKTIERKAKLKSAPRPRSDGRHSVNDWRVFLDDNSRDAGLDGTQLKARQILLQNEKLEYQIAILKAQYVPVADIEKWGAQLGKEIRNAVATIHTIAPSIVGHTIAEAEMRLRQLEDEILRTLNMLTDFRDAITPNIGEDLE
jgi:hypothetical protein